MTKSKFVLDKLTKLLEQGLISYKDLSAEFLSEIFEDKKIVLVGSMKPFEIDKVEASLNLGMAIGYLKALNECGVFICMNGFIEPWDKIQKNRKFGKFEIVK